MHELHNGPYRTWRNLCATPYLIWENESDVIVVDFGVDEERSLKIDSAESVESDGQARIGVHRLNDLGTLEYIFEWDSIEKLVRNLKNGLTLFKIVTN